MHIMTSPNMGFQERTVLLLTSPFLHLESRGSSTQVAGGLRTNWVAVSTSDIKRTACLHEGKYIPALSIYRSDERVFSAAVRPQEHAPPKILQLCLMRCPGFHPKQKRGHFKRLHKYVQISEDLRIFSCNLVFQIPFFLCSFRDLRKNLKTNLKKRSMKLMILTIFN